MGDEKQVRISAVEAHGWHCLKAIVTNSAAPGCDGLKLQFAKGIGEAATKESIKHVLDSSETLVEIQCCPKTQQTFPNNSVSQMA